MNLLIKLGFNGLLKKDGSDVAAFYNKIAKYYDSQPGNLLHILDEAIFKDLFNNIELQGKTVADIGCGTGRHWQYLLSKEPAGLIGFDVSESMLDILRSKHFPANVYMQRDDRLDQLGNQSCDLLISTLTIGYVNNIEQIFSEWNRVLKPGGDIIFTDYHPSLLTKGGNRNFQINDKSTSAKNYIHSIKKIEKIAFDLGWKTIQFQEKHIDENVKSYYLEQNALQVYEKFKGTPLIYGWHLKKIRCCFVICGL